MSAALGMSEYADTPDPWAWARARWPGKPVIRVIDVPTGRQAFAQLEAETGLLVDGSTHFHRTPPGGLPAGAHEALIAECDRAWQEPGQ